MKKLILAFALTVTFVACSGPATEVTAPVADSSAVAVDITAKCAIDSCAAVCADSASAVK